MFIRKTLQGGWIFDVVAAQGHARGIIARALQRRLVGGWEIVPGVEADL